MMGRKIYLPLILASFFISTLAVAQSGELRGKVIDKGTNEPIPFASVAAFRGGVQVLGAVADIDGQYSIKPLNPGSYDVKATNVGYQPSGVTGVQVSVDKATFVNIELT